jgi:maltodextrin utilization protein YvdJ
MPRYVLDGELVNEFVERVTQSFSAILTELSEEAGRLADLSAIVVELSHRENVDPATAQAVEKAAREQERRIKGIRLSNA